MTQEQIRFIENNLQLSNRELAETLDKSIGQIKWLLRSQQIIRTKEQKEQIWLRKAVHQSGNLNPNWRNGISKDLTRYKNIQKNRYPEKFRARDAVRKAKRNGNLVPKSCERCGLQNKIEAHHKNYSRPLDVIFLCRDCHREIHRAEKFLTNTSSLILNTQNK